MSSATSFSSVYSAVLRGGSGRVVDVTGDRRSLPVRLWVGPATASDRVVLTHCLGPTLDIGCGPGRMAEALAENGRPVLGIDLVPQAVSLTRARGVAAVERDVFDPVPGEGRWHSALLADGNIGIGGDPRRLLARAATLIRPGGRLVVDLAPPGTGIRTERLRLLAEGRHSSPFAWSVVAVDAFTLLLPGTDLTLHGIHHTEDRWFAVAERSHR